MIHNHNTLLQTVQEGLQMEPAAERTQRWCQAARHVAYGEESSRSCGGEPVVGRVLIIE